MSTVLDGYLVEGRTPLKTMVDDEVYQRLEQRERSIVTLLQATEVLQFQIVRVLLEIQQQELYRVRWNPASGRFYSSFNEYLAAVLQEWRVFGLISASSRRQVYEYIRLEKVFVQQLGVPEEDIVELGVTNFVRLAEALPVRDGKVLELSATELAQRQKISPQDALGIVDEMRARQGQWRVADTVERLDETRGVSRREVKLYWRKLRNGNYALADMVIWDGSGGQSALRGEIAEDVLQWVGKRLGVEMVVEGSELG